MVIYHLYFVFILSTLPPRQPPKRSSTDDSALSDASALMAGAQFYTSTAFNPALCATFWTGLSANNTAAAVLSGLLSYIPCNLFNALELQLIGVGISTYC